MPDRAGQETLPHFCSPDNPKYRANYEELLRPFDGWGFERMEPLVVTGPTSEEAIRRAYELGRTI